jgi:hypothetical protein
VKRLGGFSIMETGTQFHVENDLEPKCLEIWELGCTTTPHTTYELMFYTLHVSTNTNGFDNILQGMVLLAYMQIMEKLIFS